MMGKHVRVAVSAESSETVAAIQDRFRLFVKRWFPEAEVQFIEVANSDDDSVYKQILHGWREAQPDIVLLRHYVLEEEFEWIEHMPGVPKNPWMFSISSHDDPLEFLGWEDDGHEPISPGAQMLKVAIENVLGEKTT